MVNGAFFIPKFRKTHSYDLYFVLNAVFGMSSSLMRILLYPLAVIKDIKENSWLCFKGRNPSGDHM